MRPILNLVAIISFALIGKLVFARQSNSLEWEQFKRQHGKVYATPDEDSQRFALFLATKEKIRRHNADPNASHELGLNEFSDWTQQEIAELDNPVEQKLLVAGAKNDAFMQSILNDPNPLPAEVDWTKVANRVGPVKNQHCCGACWAFAATGVLEGQQVPRNISTSLIPLSEQCLMDCSFSNRGCRGGSMYFAFMDFLGKAGVVSKKDYPYRAARGKCKLDDEKAVMESYGAVDLPEGEDTIKKFVANYGPVSISMVEGSLRLYKSGIFNDPACTGNIGHSVLVVGYGTDPEHGDYWKVKNSWGAKWGEDGYFRIKRGVGMCRIGVVATIAKTVSEW